MIRTKTAFLVVAIFAFAITVQEANSASFNATGAVREGAAGASLLQKVDGCHTNCLWGWYRAGNGVRYIGCHRNIWSCAFASPCNPRACRWWHLWH